MSTTTPNLGLFKYDPSTDGAQTFNITKALNENWDKVDKSVLLALAAAAPYSTSQTYAVGAYCTRDGKLYRCTTAITAAETWTEAHWTETTVGAELVSIYTTLSKKAPGGYGLGTNAVPIDDYNNAVYNGWYRGGTNYPSKINFAVYGMVRVDCIGQVIFQTFYAGDTGNAMVSPLMAIRKSIDYGATWSEWEYVNPPMVIGVEYRTTERYLGKPVYVKLVNFGNYPASGTKTVAHEISNVKSIVSCLGTSSLGYSVNGYSYVSAFYADKTNINITVTADYSSNQVKVMLKYTKTTD